VRVGPRLQDVEARGRLRFVPLVDVRVRALKETLGRCECDGLASLGKWRLASGAKLN
jgi:hypothetical protein